MKKFTSHLFLAASFFAALTMSAAKMRPYMLMAARMDNAQATPSVSATGGYGVATFLLNSTRDTMCVNVTVHGLTGAISSAHIHSGALGVAGGVLVDLSTGIMGNRIVATITGTALTTAIKSSMLKGLTYINIHTAANAGGEIRGQIYLESDMSFVGALDGLQQVPVPVVTSANGYAVFNVSKDQSKVNFYVITNGLSGPINGGVHLHAAPTGSNGGVIQDLTTYTMTGNVLMGSFTPSATVVTNLMAGTCYINVHTAANPGGEIRGQLKMDDKIAFDAWMDGAQETPSLAVAAKGLTSLRLNTTFDTLWYNVYTTALTGSIVSAHLHTGAPGVAGPVAAAYASTSNNYISGTITGAALTTAMINNMLTGNIYSNVHTSVNAGGEIRGQVWRVMREGYTIFMDGGQQSPTPVNTSAKGSGMVSVNRNWDNAHYMIQTTAVTSETGIHFHKAKAGASGPVVDDISTVYANAGAYGYWKITDATPFSPFTMALADAMDSDSLYVNLHTTANANGEIRGQVWSGFKCGVATGIAPIAGITDNGVSVYPNPAHGNFSVAFGTETNEQVTISVYDIIGKTVINTTVDTHVGDNTARLDMKNALPGLYFVKVSNGKNEVIKKLIVE